MNYMRHCGVTGTLRLCKGRPKSMSCQRMSGLPARLHSSKKVSEQRAYDVMLQRLLLMPGHCQCTMYMAVNHRAGGQYVVPCG